MNTNLFKKVVENVYTKGAYNNTWIDGNDRGIKCIDLSHNVNLRTINHYTIQEIALYLYGGELVLAIHGWCTEDTYQEECITFYSENMKAYNENVMTFGDDTLKELYRIVRPTTYKIHFESRMNNVEVANLTYGEFATLKDAAEQISKEATNVVESKNGYFAQFNEQMLSDGSDYKFSWLGSWDDTELIESCSLYWIYENKGTFLEWKIITD